MMAVIKAPGRYSQMPDRTSNRLTHECGCPFFTILVHGINPQLATQNRLESLLKHNSQQTMINAVKHPMAPLVRPTLKRPENTVRRRRSVKNPV